MKFQSQWNTYKTQHKILAYATTEHNVVEIAQFRHKICLCQRYRFIIFIAVARQNVCYKAENYIYV